jgi:hypothetical protein
MTRKTWIDDFLERFQHRWETNPQYRAAMSGVLGLVFLITICGCVGVVSTGATSVLHAMGIGATANDGPNQPGGTGSDIKGVATFPLTTVTPPQPGSIPYATIPASGTQVPTATPSPTPTDIPTATPCVSNCGGGGGGGCNGCTTWGTAGTWHANTSNQFVLHTSQPNVGVSVIFENVPGVAGGTITQFQPAGQTDGAGTLTLYWSAPSTLTFGTAHGTITAAFNQGIVLGSFNVQCAP